MTTLGDVNYGGITGSHTYGLMQQLTSDLPDMVFYGKDDAGAGVSMTLKPEADISTIELMKINMLIATFIIGGHNTNPLAYIKKHNLERHFTYS